MAGAKTNRSASESKLPPGLYIVATPIGNLGDMSERALETLRGAAVIACEDSRVTGKLCSLMGISARLLPYHEHNAERARPAILERLRAKEAVALVSDAGTPLISDPGFKLVRACREEGFPVIAIPGPSALLTALVISGLPCDRFLFAGFLPNKKGARRSELSELVSLKATLAFYESPRRLAESLADMAVVLGGERQAVVARELTKLFEEVRTGTLNELAARYAEEAAPKGEVTLLVGPPLEGSSEASVEDMEHALRKAMSSMSIKDAVAAVAAASGRNKREVYAAALALKDEDS
jgi:16S rRNA (cytidine1402-2'-O)-methyltransferase